MPLSFCTLFCVLKKYPFPIRPPCRLALRSVWSCKFPLFNVFMAFIISFLVGLLLFTSPNSSAGFTTAKFSGAGLLSFLFQFFSEYSTLLFIYFTVVVCFQFNWFVEYSAHHLVKL